jgi:hypothetical protein
MGALDCIIAAALGHGRHAFADGLEDLIGFEVAAVDHAVDDDARVVEDGVVVFEL